MVTVIECRKDNGELTDLIFDEPEHAVRKSLEYYKNNQYMEFKPVDYPNHWGVQFRDFVAKLNE